MTVPSWLFLAFAACGALLFNLSNQSAWRQAILLLCNIAFLASFAGQPGALAPFAAFLLAGYGAIIATQRQPKLWAWWVSGLILAFFWLKQYAFIPSIAYLQIAYVTVGLSYVFFRVLHLVIDTGAMRAEPITPVRYLNYTLNFATLFAGPIQRYEDYRKTTETAPASLGAADLAASFERILIGLFKVMVLAAILAKLRANALQDIVDPRVYWASPLIGAFLLCSYPVYLYWNFSGYVDVVIGVARWFRIELPENFDKPFRATSFIDYWNRWHMTLSKWLKTYVYNPLLMLLMRRFRSIKLEPYIGAFALFVTFFLIGAWHGRTATFLFFGVLNGGGVAVNQMFRTAASKRLTRKRYAKLCKQPEYITICRGLTLSWVGFTLLWFWSSWTELAQIAAALRPVGVLATCIFSFVAATAGLWLFHSLNDWIGRVRCRPWFSNTVLRPAGSAALLTIIFLTLVALESPAPEIIYKSF